MNQFTLIDLHNHLDNIFPPVMPWIATNILGQQIKLKEILNQVKERNQRVIIVTNFYLVYPFENSYASFLRQKRKIESEIKELNCDDQKDITIIKNAQDLEKEFSLGIIWAMESCRWMYDYKKILPQLWEEGVRMLTPVHFLSNFIGAACNEPYIPINLLKAKVLTHPGRAFLRMANELGFMLDFSHMHSETLRDAINVVKDNILFSHIALADLVPYKRNVLISSMKKISHKNSLFGLIAWKKLIKNEKLFFENINLLIENQLTEKIGLGSDYGAPINTLNQTKNYSNLIDTISNSTLSDGLQQDILWKNSYHFLQKALPPD